MTTIILIAACSKSVPFLPPLLTHLSFLRSAAGNRSIGVEVGNGNNSGDGDCYDDDIERDILLGYCWRHFEAWGMWEYADS